MDPSFTPRVGIAFSRNESLTANANGVQVELIRNGLCPYHPDIQLRTVCLGAYIFWKPSRDHCPKCDPTYSIIEKMKAMCSDPLIKAGILNELVTLAACNNQDQIATKGGIDEIVTAMRTYSTSVEVQQNGILALGSLAVNNDNNKVKIVLNGLTNILDAMRDYHGNPDVQHYGCKELSNLSMMDTNRMRIAGEGGLSLILSAMTDHSIAKVQEYGCAALGNLADNDDFRNSIKSETISKDAIIKAIMSAMEKNSKNEKVQEYGCVALGNLAEDDTIRDSFDSTHVKQIESAMKGNIFNAGIKKKGNRALRLMK